MILWWCRRRDSNPVWSPVGANCVERVGTHSRTPCLSVRVSKFDDRDVYVNWSRNSVSSVFEKKKISGWQNLLFILFCIISVDFESFYWILSDRTRIIIDNYIVHTPKMAAFEGVRWNWGPSRPKRENLLSGQDRRGTRSRPILSEDSKKNLRKLLVEANRHRNPRRELPALTTDFKKDVYELLKNYPMVRKFSLFLVVRLFRSEMNWLIDVQGYRVPQNSLLFPLRIGLFAFYYMMCDISRNAILVPNI